MTEEITFIPYEVAKKIVGAVMEEEHIQEPDRRILTVYDLSNKAICWFDAEDIMKELAAQEGGIPKNKDDMKAAAVELVLRQIPKWAVENILRELEKKIK